MLTVNKLTILGAPDLSGSPKKMEELESIRGVAALLIIFFHIPKWNPIYSL